MKIKVGIIRGASKEEVESKKFNIYIGISLGNKWFTKKENIKEYILWSLKHTKNRVAILIADTLHAINYEVRNKKNSEKAIEKSIKEGNKFETIIKEIISELPREQQEAIDILKWKETETDSFNKKLMPLFFKEFQTNIQFKKEILKLVKDFTKEEKKNFTKEEQCKLCEYVLRELPELLQGFTHKKIYFNCYVYPFDSPLTLMVEKMQNGELFPQFYEDIKNRKNIFIELKVLE